MTHEQPKLFETNDPDSAQPINTDEIARHIADNAPKGFEYENRNDIREDLGYKEVIGDTENPQIPKKLFELPGQGKGRSNNPLPTRSEILYALTPREIAEQDAINKAGAKIAREALERTKDQ